MKNLVTGVFYESLKRLFSHTQDTHGLGFSLRLPNPCSEIPNPKNPPEKAQDPLGSLRVGDSPNRVSSVVWIWPGMVLLPPGTWTQTLFRPLLGGSWDLATRAINKVTLLIITYNRYYNPN